MSQDTDKLHYVIMCGCGTIIGQCRCHSLNKKIITDTCLECLKGESIGK